MRPRGGGGGGEGGAAFSYNGAKDTPTFDEIKKKETKTCDCVCNDCNCVFTATWRQDHLHDVRLRRLPAR